MNPRRDQKLMAGSQRLRSSLAALVLAVVPLVGLGLVLSQLAGATPGACATSGPASGAYTVTVCFMSPGSGDVLIGDTTVSAEVTVTGTNPGIRRLIFYRSAVYTLTDYQSPYSFTLPTARFVDGSYTLDVEVLMRDGFKSALASNPVVFANGVTTPPVNGNTFTPSPGSPVDPGAPLILAATGDGASGEVNAGRVQDLVASWNPNVFLYLGDVYEKGTSTEFHNWYGQAGLAWGQFRSITNPTIGNHEYEGGVAPGYFDYWDNVPDYYSYDINGWHFVSINSNTNEPGISLNRGSAQYDWLAQDLASHPGCTIVYMHHPRYNIGPEGPKPELSDMWSLVVNYGVELVLTAHDHSYQRWTALDSAGNPAADGAVQFVVGGGGHGLQAAAGSDPRVVAAYSSYPNGMGALRLALNPSGASFSYRNLLGTVLDSGTITCHGSPEDTLPPTPPGDVAATATSPTQVDVSWLASTDNNGVASYTVLRDGAQVGTTNGATLAFSDLTVQPDTTYSYTVTASDAAGNVSDPSSPPAAVQTPELPSQFEFVPVADTYANASSPTTNYGNASMLRADASPDLRSFLRFNVSGLAGAAIAQATLELRAQSTSQTGFQVRELLDVSWAETALNYNNAPSCGAVIGTSDSFGNGSDVTVDVTPYVSGEGPWGFCLTTTSSTAISLSSRQGAAPPKLIIHRAGVEDTEPPSPPTGVSATVVSHADVALAWSGSTDNVAVTGYTILRDGAPVGSVDGTTLSFHDTSVAPETTYSYTVTAIDAAGNVSDPSSPPEPATTPAAPAVLSFAPVADSYVSASSPAQNYGTGSTLRADAAPEQRSFLRFDVAGITGTVVSAKLRIFANSSSSTGHRISSVSDIGWVETSITYATAPVLGPVIGSSGPFTGGQYIEVDVSAVVTGNGSLSFGLDTTSSTAIAYSSREGINPPQLIITQ